MKKYKNIFAVLTTALVAGLSLAACSSDDLDTNQYTGGVALNVYGPQPVMRGGTLRFLGSNLDQVAQVQIPGIDPITSIEVVKSGAPSEIRVQIPKEGPEPGLVTLVTKSGDKLSTKTELTYVEGIEITGFEPATAMPGQTITIKGEYLNLVNMVAFADDIRVSAADFVAHDRYAIQVIVPEEAKTGKVTLYTVDLTAVTPDDETPDYQIIVSDEAFIVGLPTVTDATQVYTAKAGQTVTVAGSTFSLIDRVVFGEGDYTTETAEFSVADDGRSLSFVLPVEAPDGPISLLTRSGIAIPAGQLVTVAPSHCVATPTPVKAGSVLTITGNDMDVVTAVEMPNVAEAIGISVEAGQVVVAAVPATAQEGDLTLRMANGKAVAVPFTLVKPQATGYNANPVSAGGVLTITGSDLDLVRSVTFGEATNESDKFEATATTINVTVPMAATAGKPLLNLANGTQVEAPELAINEAVFCYITQLPADDVELKAGGALTVTVANGDVLTAVQINGTDCQYVLASGDQLIIGIPESAGSGSVVRLISSNGDISYKMDITPSTEVNTVIWTGAVDLAGWSFNWQFGDGEHSEGEDKDAFTKMGLVAGDIIHLYATAYNDWWQIQFFDGHWSEQTEIGETFGNGNNVNSGIASLESGCLDILVTEAMATQLTTLTDWGYCWILQGEGVVITKISVTHYNTLEQNLANCITTQGDQSVLMPFPVLMSWDDTGRFRILIDRDPALKDMNLVAGKSTLYFYVTGTGQLQVNDANWSQLVMLEDWENAEARTMNLVLTADMIDWLKGNKTDGWSSTGLIIQGSGVTLNKVTILP